MSRPSRATSSPSIFACFLGEAAARHFSWRSIGLVIALGLWLTLLIPWLRRWADSNRDVEQRGLYHALWIWAITDLANVVAMFPVSA